MAYQQLTPPTMLEDEFDLQCLDRSPSTIESCFPQDWSPESLMTAATTPPKSPARMRECGPALLPKVRLQDQLITRTANPAYHGHSRTTSLPVNGNSVHMQGQRVYRPGFDRDLLAHQAAFTKRLPSPLRRLTTTSSTTKRA
ncbi:hypothetical protein LTR91_020446 [Friedmanniomyces endolithicus]|uniref:Uncharacterized protein n=1 Tax=Friedmanniomyces endolithicus TaxID=329885 RepID=A0AAN6K144_9PEZI|nr:hypothetical protein LTR57_018624 [Friedmanniomyces endolithicus]KAK0960234.1 hypothetical protein LTR91_020446 [Friedmanniomyces endolithicus]KAK1025780.1 hypothetical protein LTS16_022913 [Friedmanniomyces endolithicus]